MVAAIKRTTILISSILVTSVIVYLIITSDFNNPNNNTNPINDCQSNCFYSPYEGYQHNIEEYNDEELGPLVEINIQSSEDIPKYELTGNGSEYNPFLIDGNYYDNVRLLIKISNTGENFVIQNCYGVCIFLSDIKEGGFVIRENEFCCGSSGISLRSVFASTNITNNIFRCASAGGASIIYSKNTILMNNQFYNSGIYLITIPLYLNTTIIKDNFINERKIGFFHKEDNLEITEEHGYGQLIFAECKNILVSDVSIKDTSYGIICLSSNNVTIKGCSISGCYFGLFIQHCSLVKIENNEIFQNRLAMYFMVSSGTFTNNYFFNNLYGIDISHSSSCLIVENKIGGNNQWGISLWDACNNQIINNTIEYNDGLGLDLRCNSEGNSIHHNIFHCNGRNAKDDCANNTWFDTSTSQGNWWSDYCGKKEFVIIGTAEAVDSYPKSTEELY
ncbi:MAG: hypothetical protein HeimAB125_19860 [Candidatus Heimdallarchaeota archaeon AB_125]|nr:MAG: hypothetical protein HeimAB125_19860 [Candidatus Heimdallarchaeota archaeon AB_125]